MITQSPESLRNNHDTRNTLRRRIRRAGSAAAAVTLATTLTIAGCSSDDSKPTTENTVDTSKSGQPGKTTTTVKPQFQEPMWWRTEPNNSFTAPAALRGKFCANPGNPIGGDPAQEGKGVKDSQGGVIITASETAVRQRLDAHPSGQLALAYAWPNEKSLYSDDSGTGYGIPRDGTFPQNNGNYQIGSLGGLDAACWSYVVTGNTLAPEVEVLDVIPSTLQAATVAEMNERRIPVA